MSNCLNWGIIGAGEISKRFVSDILFLSKHPQGDNKIKHSIKAIGCSSKGKGQDFVDSNFKSEDAKPAVFSYDELLEDPTIDIVYIGLLHPFHKDITVKALTKKKHVLCEKPVTMNVKELNQILETAKENGRFFMEAMWVRFFPGFLRLQQLVKQDKVLGKVKRVQGKHDLESGDIDKDSRLVNKKLGGGALLDIGVYAITFCRLFMDSTDPLDDWSISSSQVLDSLTGNEEDQVDFILSMVFTDNIKKQQAVATCSFYSEHRGPLVTVEGELGYANVYPIGTTPAPLRFEVVLKDGTKFEESFAFENEFAGVEGFFFQAVEAGEMILKGSTESPIFPWKESINIISIMDKVREQNGLVYEQDLI